MKKSIQLLLSIIYLSTVIYPNKISAQISEGGIPPSFAYSNIQKQTKAPLSIYIDADIPKLINEDAENKANGTPLRMAKIIETKLNINNSGEWITLPSGQLIWQLSVHSPNAIATLLYYDEFYIPSGAKLFIYNNDKTQVLGAYTHATNPIGKEFATEFVAGDRFTIEYVASPESENEPRIAISGIAYGYNNIAIYNNDTKKSFGKAAPCMVNVNCIEGNDWKKQKQGIARTITPIGNYSYYCSGTVLNNTATDFSPYYLAAHHCFYSSDGSIPAGESGLNKMIFYFNYEFTDCENLNIEPQTKTMTGAQMLVDNDIQGSSDGALLIMNHDIPDDYFVYYNGWDRTNNAGTRGVTIHHPGGDVKKISTYTAPLTTSTWISNIETGAADAHWQLRFAKTANGHSVTQGGSSGAPLFNQNGLVVGTLTGGSTECSAPNNFDYFGKFWYHWDQDPNSNKYMKKHLDPANTGQTVLEGAYAKEPVPPPSNLIANIIAIENQVQIQWNKPNDDPNGELTVVKYIIYRNNVKIGETNSLVYLDTEAAGIGNNLCYKVAALYNNGTESEPTATVCTSINIPVTGIQLSPLNMRLIQGGSYSPKVVISPENASNKTVKSWVSNNPEVASVDAKGTITAKNYGKATITATTQDGNYTATTVLSVHTIAEGDIKGSEAFSPNGDGINDYFIIERIEEYPDNELVVFDRSGAVHYSTKAYTNNWDGTANKGAFTGSKLPAGTYFYQLIVKDRFDVKSFVVIRY